MIVLASRLPCFIILAVGKYIYIYMFEFLSSTAMSSSPWGLWEWDTSTTSSDSSDRTLHFRAINAFQRDKSQIYSRYLSFLSWTGTRFTSQAKHENGHNGAGTWTFCFFFFVAWILTYFGVCFPYVAPKYWAAVVDHMFGHARFWLPKAQLRWTEAPNWLLWSLPRPGEGCRKTLIFDGL